MSVCLFIFAFSCFHVSHDGRGAGRWHGDHVGSAWDGQATGAGRWYIAQLEERGERLFDPSDEGVFCALMRRIVVLHKQLRKVVVRLVSFGFPTSITAHPV